MPKVVFCDFEFSEVVEPFVKLVCAATYCPATGEKKKFWLHNSPLMQAKLADYLKQYEIIIAYSAVAECRSFMALGLDPLSFKWLDLFLEYRMMSNHNDKLNWGKQLVDGKVKFVNKPRPKWERTEEEKMTGFRPTHSLAEATFKLTGEIRDTEHKNKMRDLIISNPKSFTKEERTAIMDYCLDDVIFLPRIKEEIIKEFTRLDPSYDTQRYIRDALYRGRYSAHTAIMENRGYPLDVEKTKNFSKQIPVIMYELQKEINSLFPTIKPFKWNKPKNRFSWDQKATKDWIKANHDVKKWMKTDKGQISLALDGFQKFYSFQHSYPEDNFGAQMVRFLKLKQNLYGFSKSDDSEKRTFWDYVGSDGRVRPYMNHFGAQSSRTQPAASGFMFLKPAWMRALVQPKPGRFIASIDYGQQEFFIAGLESSDEKMIQAYLSGDPYLYGAKLAGAIPWDGTKESHKAIRDVYKNTYLGILFGMTKYGLAVKLTNDTGREWTEDEAQEQIDIFEDTFPDYMAWKRDLVSDYMAGYGIELPCVAKGVQVLTKSGQKRIEEITIKDLIWDGFAWRKHGGVVPKGEKGVIRDPGGGLTATPDHLVLHAGRWHAWLEVLEGPKSTVAQPSEASSQDGQLLALRYESKVEGMSYVAAYVELKKTLELMHCSLDALKPVLHALNLSEPKVKEAGLLARFLMTNIFGDVGKIVLGMQSVGAEIKAAQTSNGMALGGYNLSLRAFENSWNTLLLWMGIQNGGSHWTELIMTETMSPETYELLLNQRITEIEETFDILKCGPLNRFQAGGRIVHNCGWRVWPDNDNPRSVANVPIQGFGASVMRKAVDLAVVNHNCEVLFTLHDAIYIEGDIGDEEKIIGLRDSMRQAFVYYVEKKYKKHAEQIKLDPYAWSPDYKEDSHILIGKEKYKVECSNLYIDARSVSEYEKFSVFFERPVTDEL